MAEDSVSKYVNLMNHQVTSQEGLSELLTEAIAMFKVALSGDFPAFDKATIHYYLLAIDDIVIRARNVNELLLNNWVWIIKLLDPPGVPGDETKH